MTERAVADGLVEARVRECVRAFWVHDVNKPSWFSSDQNEKLVQRILAALSRQPAPEPVAGKWEIDHTTQNPILTYEKCSVIQDEQAHYLMRLIQADVAAPEPVAVLVQQLASRDNFIVERGLWSDFVATLPAAPRQER